jgi:hypothetical protein
MFSRFLLSLSLNYTIAKHLEGKFLHVSSPQLPRAKSYVDNMTKIIPSLGNFLNQFSLLSLVAQLGQKKASPMHFGPTQPDLILPNA